MDKTIPDLTPTSGLSLDCLFEIVRPVGSPPAYVSENGSLEQLATLLSGWSNTRLAKTGAYAVANTDKRKTIACSSGPWTLTFNAPSGYDADFVVTVLNESTSRSILCSISGGTNFRLYPGQSAFVYNQNNTWRIIRPTRWKLTGALTLYADVTNGSASNDGLASGSGNAFAHPNTAINLIDTEIDTNGNTVTIQCANGTYTTGIAMKNVFGGGEAIILGDEGNLDNVFFDVTGNHAAIRNDGTGVYHLRGLKLRANTAGFCIGVQYPGKVKFQNCKLGNSGWGARLGVNNQGMIEATGNFTVYESGAAWAGASFGGVISTSTRTMTLVGTPAWSGAGVTCDRLSNVECYSMTFSGSATGTRYSVAQNSVINSGGGGVRYLPGNAVGSAATGGQYV